jgi:NADPH-dependent curcumin reductase CurA
MQAAAIDHPGGPEVLGVDGAGIVAAVGTLAVQFAKLRGARVLAIASGEDGISLVQRIR